MGYKIKSWVDFGSGEMKLVVFCQEEEGKLGPSRGYTVYNLYTTEFLTLERGARVPEAFIITIPWLMGPEIERAFAEWLYGRGITPEQVTRKQGSTEGSLEATKYHLEDLRQLLKLNTEKDRIPK